MIKIFKKNFKILTALFLVLIFINLNLKNFNFFLKEKQQYQITVNFISIAELLNQTKKSQFETKPGDTNKIVEKNISNLILDYIMNSKNNNDFENDIYREAYSISMNQIFTNLNSSISYLKTSCGKGKISCFFIVQVNKGENIENFTNKFSKENKLTLSNFLKLKGFEFKDSPISFFSFQLVNESKKVLKFFIYSLITFVLFYFLMIVIIRKIFKSNIK